ncbi:MAG: hypothetical protein AB9873_14465 [Syntrophobacteraceae bacterium]
MRLPWKRWNGDAVLLDTLHGVEQELEILTESTEGEFLAIGESLQQFHRRTVEIAGISQAIARLMTGEDVDRLIAHFNEIIDRMEGLEGESRKNADTLLQVLETSAALMGQLSAFQRTVRSLRILCISIKIESARLGGDDMGFGDLGSEVGSLALEIEERCARLFSHAESLAGLIQQALVKVRDLGHRQHAQAKLMVDSILSSLGSLTEKHARSSDVARNLAIRYQSLSRSIGQIVGSMQFHDITRQQIEHAKDALSMIENRLSSPSSSGAPDADRGCDCVGGKAFDAASVLNRFMDRVTFWRCNASGRSTETLGMAGDICALQIAQLQHARDGLVGAVNNIADNLRAVSGLVTEMSQEARQMVGAAGETDRLSLEDIGAGFTSILAAHCGYADAGTELSQVMTALAGTLGDMSGYTTDIESIGAKIKLIALNAIVKAAHIGDSGVSLGVLAEGIHELSVETGRQTERVTESLASIIAASQSLRVGGSEDRDGRVGLMTHLEAALKTLPDTLREVNGELLGLLSRMDEDGRELSAEILRVIDDISVHKRVDAVICGAVSRLEEIVALSTSRRGDEDEAARAKRMKALEASYTMEEEREIHQSILVSGLVLEATLPDSIALSDGNGAERHEVAASSDTEAEEDLGDNVELF